MSKIVLVEMPAHGHVNPSLPVVHELARRGEHVVYYDTEEFQPQVERVGATFRAYPAGVLTSTDIAYATQSGDLLRVPGLILRATESLLPFLLEELPGQQPDVIVLDSNALWGHVAARMLNLPTVSFDDHIHADLGAVSASIPARVGAYVSIHAPKPAASSVDSLAPDSPLRQIGFFRGLHSPRAAA